MASAKSDRLINPLFGHINQHSERVVEAIAQSRRSTDFYVERLEKKLDAAIDRLERKMDQVIDGQRRAKSDKSG